MTAKNRFCEQRVFLTNNSQPKTHNAIVMLSQAYYLIRSRADGSYLVAHPHGGEQRTERQQEHASFLLLFREHFDALSYLNTHALDVADRFTVESIPGTQIDSLLKRWSFTGVGVVQDPLIPRVEFLSK